MTRKRFWKLRNAMEVRLLAWSKANGMGFKGTVIRSSRPVPGKPLVRFGTPGYGNSYDEVWNSEGMKSFRKSLGMEV